MESVAPAPSTALVVEDHNDQMRLEQIIAEKTILVERLNLSETTIFTLNQSLDNFRSTLSTLADDNAKAHAIIKTQAAIILDLELKIALAGRVEIGAGGAIVKRMASTKLLPALSELKSRPSTANVMGRKESKKYQDNFWDQVSVKAQQHIK